MAKAHFELAKEYILAREYHKAREVLEAIPENPTAQKWLAKLDEIDPPFPDVAPDTFTDRSPVKEKRMSSSQKNAALDEEIEKARKVGLGVFIFVMGAIVVLPMLIFNPLGRNITVSLDPGYGSVSIPPPSSNNIATAVVVGLGLLCMCLGIYLWYTGRTDKIREPLAKGNAKNIKRSGLMFLGLAVVFAFVGIVTKQTSQLGFSIIWAINAGIMLLYQLPKAEEFDRQQVLLKGGEKAKRSDW